jgi:hypothetical protein
VKLVILFVVLAGAISWSGTAQIGSSTTKADAAIRRFLVGYVASHHMDVDDARYAVGFVDLNGDNVDEAIVYLMGPDWCGTGGCQTLVLTQSGDSYRVIARILATRPPIRALGERAHGWRTLTAQVHGGGILREYEAKLLFDGNSYPISAAPAYAPRLRSNIEGEVVIPAAAGDVRNGRALSGDR